MIKMKSIKIIGAGLSGLTAAINLARVGYNVDIFEKRNDCGGRFKGDLEGLENWSSKRDTLDELKSMNIRINFDCDPFRTMYLSDGEEKIRFVSKKPIFYLVKRGVIEKSLDQGLKNQAIESGVNIHFNSKRSSKDVDIISTGPSTNKITAMAIGILFETEMDDVAIALVNKKTSYKGYSYLLVNKGYGCMCTVSIYKFSNMKTYYKKTYEIFNKLVDLKIRNPRNVGGIGSFLFKWKLQEDGKLITGEAAGLQDFLWGFGMRYAFASGFLAAKSIIGGESYKSLIKERFSDKIKASVVNRFYVEKFDNYGKILINLGKKLKEEGHINLLYSRYNLSLYGRLLYPFARFSLSRKYKDKK
jgi:flavin-dependent dehydrogenase